MNNYLYRGQTLTGEWVYGDLLTGRMTCGEMCIVDNEKDTIFDVLPESVGQWTGLVDKNNAKIFTNDILLSQEFQTRPWSKSAKKKRFTGVVVFDVTTYEASFSCNWQDRGEYTHGSWSDFYDCEIIGNTTDTPELSK